MRASLLGAALLVALAALGSGCASAEPREGSVRFRDQIGKEGRGGRTITVTTEDARRMRSAASTISSEEMGALVADLEDIGLFELRGAPSAPPELPLGAISVQVTGKPPFTVSTREISTADESKVFSRAAARVIEATQSGPHYALQGPPGDDGDGK